MEKIKKNWQIIAIVLLLVFGMSKCTQSCNRSAEIDKNVLTIEKKDSLIKVLKDSVVTLNHKIDLLRNDKSNQEKLIESQKESINKINEARKNIHVTVRK